MHGDGLSSSKCAKRKNILSCISIERDLCMIGLKMYTKKRILNCLSNGGCKDYTVISD